jgi:molybdopterin molybdotransferase
MLNVLSQERALEIILSQVSEIEKNNEDIPLLQAVSRIAAKDIDSFENIPHFNRSTVDGFALRASDTFGCSESLPAMLRFKGKIIMGEDRALSIDGGECMEIPTGGMLPENADAVSMVEYTENYGDEFRYIQKPAAPLENVIRTGEDVSKGQKVIEKGTVLRIQEIGVLSALGIDIVSVKKPLTVGIISTGDEIIPFTEKPKGSQIRDINSSLLAAAAAGTFCRSMNYPIVPDDERKLQKAVRTALDECDALLISGGSSAGEKDAVSRVLSALGTVHFHGIAIKPGKPTVFATASGKPVFGLPGHPVAAYFVFRLFVRTMLYKMLGVKQNDLCFNAVISQNIPSDHGREEIIPVSIKNGIASPVFGKAGIISVLSRADGYIIIGRNSEGVLKGEAVKVYLF